LIILKKRKEIEKIRVACQIVAKVLYEVSQRVRPGVTTYELNELSEKLAKKEKAKPAFKGYRGYPFSLCTSVNDEIVHGLPSRKRVLREGDLISLDFGVVKNGYYGDAAVTVPVGEVSEEAKKLIEVTREALYRGIAKAHPKYRLFDISHAIQSYVESHGFSVVRDFVGHGIGKNLHESPQIPNFGKKGHGIRLKPGMVLAIEPMINQGTYEIRILADNWTAVTKDGKLSAHFEHTVAITESGPDILTELK